MANQPRLTLRGVWVNERDNNDAGCPQLIPEFDRWQGLPVENLTITEDVTKALQKALRRCYWPNQLRGRHRHVHHYPRHNGVDYFFAYLDNWPDTLLAFDADGEVEQHAERYAFSHVFAFDAQTGTLDLIAKGGRKIQQHLRQAFCSAVLGQDAGNSVPLRPAYRLDHLLTSGLTFATDPSDQIADVRLTRIRIAPRGMLKDVRYEEIGFSSRTSLP